MVFRNIVPSHLSALSLQQSLDLTNMYLANAYSTKDNDLALVLCHDAEIALSQAKTASKEYPAHAKDTRYQMLREGVAAAFIDLGKLMDRQGYQEKARTICKKAEKWGGNAHDPGRLAQFTPLVSTTQPPSGTRTPSETQIVGTLNSSTAQRGQRRGTDILPPHIFATSVQPLTKDFKLPEADERLSNIPQLVYCLSVLQESQSNNEVLEPVALRWLKAIEKDADEQERLYAMVAELIRAFKRDEIKDTKTVAEVVCLAPVLSKDVFSDLVQEFYSGIKNSDLLNFHQLEGLVQMIQCGNPGYFSADDLVKILELLSTRLRDTHKQSGHHLYHLTLAVSHVLDTMADTKVTGLSREKLHEPLSTYLNELRESSDPFLAYQAAYAYQALLWVPDDETLWQATIRRTGKVVKGVSGLVSAVKGLDLVKFIEGLEDIQKGFEGVSKAVDVAKSAYIGVSTLAHSGHDFLNCLKEGLSFERKREWYSALRGADVLIQGGEFATFKKLVCDAPCRYDAAFQWGVCQRLGEIAANPSWDPVIRRGAISFLGEVYKNDEMWGQQPSIKQWDLNILMQLTSTDTSEGSLQLHAIASTTQLQELETCGDHRKQDLYRACRQHGPINCPLNISLPEVGSTSLLERVQNRPDVEGNIRMLRRQRTKERDNVYIQPQAKANVHASDESRFPLMEKVKEFLDGDQKVFLILGDSGAGKSTFSRELEFELWQSYKNKTGRIPLHINLPAIDKPEHDMIAKQLRKVEFTEPQIREMKHYRKFILICDGYDESQQMHNLYMSNQLNQPREWDAQMIISCRSEYLGSNYQDQFQPGDRNHQSVSPLFQEAVITPFSFKQVQDYIQQYVAVYQPLWRADDYKQALELIPSLKDLVSNPFLMTLSLEVLPRMVDPGLHLSSTQVTRVILYDHFVEQWLERSKKRISDKALTPQAKAAFERLSAEGFTLNGIEFLKRLAVAIYKEQDGHPVVEFSHLKDEGSWKDSLFKEEHKQLLLEACPLTRNGNQHRFIHRSILEYGLACAVFDPRDKRTGSVPEAVLHRRGSASSALSFELRGDTDDTATVVQQPDPLSPLVWRSFINDQSLLQFLVERAQQESIFKDQLLSYVEYSKKDKKWRTAAANAITILVRAGVQFIGKDLRGIQIPGADLSYGVFNSAQLQDADLRKVDFRGVWLQQADLSKASMTSVQFGELPYLSEDEEVQEFAYSPDGQLFAVGLDSGNITIYSTSNWEKTLTLIGHTNSIMSVRFSPGGNEIVSCSRDSTMRFWELETGICRQIIIGHTGYVNCIKYSPAGDLIASAGNDKTVKLWDYRGMISSPDYVINWIDFSPTGEQIVSGSDDKLLRVWTTKTGICCLTLSGHSESVWCVAYSPRGHQLASASFDKTIRLWDADAGVCQHTLVGHHYDIMSIVYSPDGSRIASGCEDYTVRLWDSETGICLHTLTGHRGSVSCVAYSPTGNQLASGGIDDTVRLWNVSARASQYVSSGHSNCVFSVKCSPKGNQFVSSSGDTTICIWDAGTGACLRTLRGHDSAVTSVAYSPDGSMIASGCRGGMSVRTWDVESGICRRILTGHSDWVTCVAFSPKGDLIVSGSYDSTIRLWDATSGECREILYYHEYGITSIALSSNGVWIASGSFDSTVRIWNIGASACHHVLKGHDGWARCVEFSPQGNQLASGGFDATIRLWDVETGNCEMILIGHGRDVLGVTYSPDGDLLASGGFDNIARIWDVASGQCRAVISESQNIVSGIAWNVISEVRCLVTGCEDGSVQNWQLLGEADQFQVRLCWSGTNGALRVTGANMQDARGLTQLDKQLLKQRGAVGEPENLLREASKKMSAMASVVSKLKRLSDKAVGDSSSDANTLCNQLEQQIDKPDAKQLQHQAEQPNQDAERLEQHLDQLGKHAEQPEQPIPEDQQDDS